MQVLSKRITLRRTLMSRSGSMNTNRRIEHIPLNNPLANPKRDSCKIFMTGVPRLKWGNWESEESLINKVTHWIRKVRNCRSLIQSDIAEAIHHHTLGGMMII